MIFDTIGILLMILALLTGWLPGPGGIPLFILGLAIFAVHHDWAQKYINTIKVWVDAAGERVFTNNKNLQLAYDVIAPMLIVGGAYVLYVHNAIWQISVAIFFIIFGLTIFAGNRNRLRKLKKKLKF